jgi:hypothetical protein
MTAFDPALIAWLGEADVVVHETNHGVHTPYGKLAALPVALRSRMRLDRLTWKPRDGPQSPIAR